MAQIELSLAEILTLEAELNGFVNQQTNERVLEGFLKEKLNLATKYRLTKLSEELKSEKVILDSMRDELIKEYGTDKDGQVSIEMFEDKKRTKINPKFLEFQEKYTELLNEKKEINYTPLSISELESIDTNENYIVLFKLIQE